MRALRVLAVAVAVVVAGCGDDGPPKVAATVSGVDVTSERVERLTGQWVKTQTAQALQTGAPGGETDRKSAAKLVLGFVIRSVFLERVAADMGVQDNPTGLEDVASEQVPAAEFESAGWSKTDLDQSLRDARLSKAIGEKVFPKVAVSDVGAPPEVRAQQRLLQPDLADAGPRRLLRRSRSGQDAEGAAPGRRGVRRRRAWNWAPSRLAASASSLR